MLDFILIVRFYALFLCFSLLSEENIERLLELKGDALHPIPEFIIGFRHTFALFLLLFMFGLDLLSL